MSPQFVDFNADGHLDIVAGTFDGSPHVAFGSNKGWQQPEQILDAAGVRIVLNDFWNFDTKKWEATTRCDAEGATAPNGHCTSAVAIDWDADGDLDLLLGDHREGHVYLRMNEGTAGRASFAAKNVPVLAGGEPLVVPGTVATMRLVDWNRDGLIDLVCSSMGDANGDKEGGGVFLFRNAGDKTAPIFAEPVVLVAVSKKASTDAPVRPDSGIYVDVLDHDGDSDLDLVVGGYSHWVPKAPVLTAEQQQRVVDLRAELAQLDAAAQAFFEALVKGSEGLEQEASNKKRQELFDGQREARAVLAKKRAPVAAELEILAPGPQRRAFVWIYENQTVTAGN